MSDKYIPKDLNDCFKELTKAFIDKDYLTFKNKTEKDIVLYHHTLGRCIRNKWDLWGESRLSKWFNDKGIHHADDMSGIILTSFWREANSQPIKLEEQIKEYQDFWEKAK